MLTNVAVNWHKFILSIFKHLSMTANLDVLWTAPPGAPTVFPCVDTYQKLCIRANVCMPHCVSVCLTLNDAV